MRKKIFKYSFLQGAAILLICGLLFFMLQYSQTITESAQALKEEAAYATGGLSIGGLSYLEGLSDVSRVTWIGPDGRVLYDSEYPELTDSQKDCPEVAEALSRGEGQAIRHSGSSRETTMYYAFRCPDGTVLRLSRSARILLYALTSVIPITWVLILVLIISGIMSFRMARQILRPIIGLDPDSTSLTSLQDAIPYPELLPLLSRLEQQQNTIREEAAQREALRKEFSANVSHELKTPLTSISGFAELIRDGLLPEDKIPECAGDIYDESQRLLALIEDIIRLSKLDEETGFPEKESLSLYDMAQEVISSLSSQAKSHNIQLSLTGSDVRIMGVYQIVYEMLYNLCDNAIKYNYHGGHVHMETGLRDGCACFIITDTGIGIPKKDQERVFERFYRVDRSHSRKIGGTGLGLSIVKHAAIFHNARIALESTPGKGTRITLTFPKEAGEAS